MTEDPAPHPDRPRSARPVRVARFDAFPDADPDDASSLDANGRERTREDARVAGLDVPAAPARVAGFDAPDHERPGAVTGSAPRVAGLDALPTSRATAAPVADLDVLRARAAAVRVGGRTDAPPGRRADRDHPERPVASVPAPVDRPDPTSDTDTDTDTDTDLDVPPDAPLPRGRRRRPRAGRLGPDAPRPDAPEPAEPADPVAVAREICLRLLTDRARTRQELAQALARKDVPAEAAATVLDRFDEVGLIDDAAFAGQWVRSRHAHRGLGRRAIAVELRRKGVADDVAGEALAEVDAEAEARRARELVDRKLRTLTLDTAEQRAASARRVVGMLARKGYGAGTAYRVVREALAERGAEIDELGGGPTD